MKTTYTKTIKTANSSQCIVVELLPRGNMFAMSTTKQEELNRLNAYINLQFKNRHTPLSVKQKRYKRESIRDAVLARRLFQKVSEDHASMILRNRKLFNRKIEFTIGDI